MTIKQQGGVFGRNPSFNDVDVNTLDVTGQVTSGGLNVDAGTLFVDPVNNFVGIGTPAPVDRLTVNGNVYLGATSRTVYTTGSADLRLQTGTGNTIIYRDNAATEVASFTSTGLAFPDGKGIDFSATSGTGTSELFDDYEEGTFTPGLSDGTTQAAFGSTSGRYTKIGDTVTVHISLVDINTTGLIAGALIRVTGLPFTAISSVFSTAPIWFASVISTSGNIVGLVNGNTTLLTLGNGTTTGMTNAVVSQITSGSGDIYLTATYKTA